MAEMPGETVAQKQFLILGEFFSCYHIGLIFLFELVLFRKSFQAVKVEVAEMGGRKMSCEIKGIVRIEDLDWKRFRIDGRTLWVAKTEIGYWVAERKSHIPCPFFVTLPGAPLPNGYFKTVLGCTCQPSAQIGQECIHTKAAQKMRLQNP